MKNITVTLYILSYICIHVCISFADERGQFRYGGNAVTVKINTIL